MLRQAQALTLKRKRRVTRSAPHSQQSARLLFSVCGGRGLNRRSGITPPPIQQNTLAGPPRLVADTPKMDLIIPKIIILSIYLKNLIIFLVELITRQLHNLLIKSGKKIAVAESCTGGLVSKLLTDVSGSAKYFTAGFVTYGNQAKIDILKIPAKIIAQKGAVSKETASLMAQSAKKIAKSDFGIGITGIAGPTGGSPRKPIGTVFIAIDSKGKKFCHEFHFIGNRASIKKKTALKALELLRGTLYHNLLCDMNKERNGPKG